MIRFTLKMAGLAFSGLLSNLEQNNFRRVVRDLLISGDEADCFWQHKTLPLQ